MYIKKEISIPSYKFHLGSEKSVEKFRKDIGVPSYEKTERFYWPTFLSVAFTFGDDEPLIRLNLNAWKTLGHFMDDCQLNPNAIAEYEQLVGGRYGSVKKEKKDKTDTTDTTYTTYSTASTTQETSEAKEINSTVEMPEENTGDEIAATSDNGTKSADEINASVPAPAYAPAVKQEPLRESVHHSYQEELSPSGEKVTSDKEESNEEDSDEKDITSDELEKIPLIHPRALGRLEEVGNKTLDSYIMADVIKDRRTLSFSFVDVCSQCGFLLGIGLLYAYIYTSRGRNQQDLVSAKVFLEEWVNRENLAEERPIFSPSFDMHTLNTYSLPFQLFKDLPFLEKWKTDNTPLQNVQGVISWINDVLKNGYKSNLRYEL